MSNFERGLLPDQREALPYTERTFVVWGGANGIGLRASAEFASRGATVYVGTTRPENFNRALTALGPLQRSEKLVVPTDHLFPLVADVTDKSQIARAVREIKLHGHGVTDVIFSQAGGMEGYMQQLLDKYIDPIAEYTLDTPIEELSRTDRQTVEETLTAMNQQLPVWVNEAMPHAIAVNYQGTFDAIDVMGEEFPNGFRGVFYNSTWGELSGRFGVEIPNMYRPVDVSKGMVRDRLEHDGPQLAQQGIYIDKVTASLVKDTNVGKIFKDYFVNLMDPDQREAVVGSSIRSRDVVTATKMLFDTNPERMAHPITLYVFGKDGKPEFRTSLDMSSMYTKPYRF